jgi:hypothetical protein
LVGVEIRKRSSLMCELHQILDEELFWYRRCHKSWLWLLKGDNDTEYFHTLVNGRKRKQTIFSLMDGEDRVSGTDNLLKHATSFYKALFGLGKGDAFQMDQDLWPIEDRVTTNENDALTGEFTEEEIKSALFQMEKNKATGPDGFPIEFFQVCWDFVKSDIVDMFRDFHDRSLDIKRLNNGIITLIPKVK